MSLLPLSSLPFLFWPSSTWLLSSLPSSSLLISSFYLNIRTWGCLHTEVNYAVCIIFDCNRWKNTNWSLKSLHCHMDIETGSLQAAFRLWTRFMRQCSWYLNSIFLKLVHFRYFLVILSYSFACLSYYLDYLLSFCWVVYLNST